ncbi:glycerophosphodiester phosphodiesterase family protein [Mobilicoccus pelagius]|uniref:glycerophosphodiester phosphodiesterase family protein n=1 Tax=Mobilicoccus pelagius TaxID=746032 RepID=UPI001FDFA6E9|nr:glycerophosphodiester phosphodiesterase family protein [Mobilicoccus pelagius]
MSTRPASSSPTASPGPAVPARGGHPLLPAPREHVAVFGHRGARGDVCESTVEGFLHAARVGALGVELDVLLTADDAAIVWHDPVLADDKCTTDLPGLVGRAVLDCTLGELMHLDIGSRTQAAFPHQRAVPGARPHTLAEVLAVLRDQAPDLVVIVEVKSDPRGAAAPDRRRRLVEATLRDVDAAGARDRVVMHSFDWSVLPLVADLAPDLPRSALALPGETFLAGSDWLVSGVYEDHDGDLVDAARAVGAHYVCPRHRARRRAQALDEGIPGRAAADLTAYDVVDADFVRRAHAAGLGVVPWTVDDPADLRHLAHCGVDAVVCDHPGDAVRLLADI